MDKEYFAIKLIDIVGAEQSKQVSNMIHNQMVDWFHANKELLRSFVKSIMLQDYQTKVKEIVKDQIVFSQPRFNSFDESLGVYKGLFISE
jgi:hypothetical protein